MDREAIAYMLFISSALYLKERNIKPFCQEALYIYCKPFASALLLILMKGINDISERNMGFIT